MNLEIYTIVTFAIYFLFLLSIGIYFYSRNKNIEDYFQGGKSFGKWVTALSTQAADMSGWLLMGLPGAIYLGGLQESWIAVGLILGTYFNWRLVAPRLRVATEYFHSLTFPTFFEERLKDPTRSIRICTALIILFFFTIYTASGFVASGKLFSTLFPELGYEWALLIGWFVIIFYTFLGGYFAVCWTDFFQGCIMFFALTITPLMAFFNVGGWDTISQTVQNFKGELPWNASPLLILSALAWGLGYFGQPHILARFMTIKEVMELKQARAIAMIWVIISLLGAILVGFIGIPLIPGLKGVESEKIFIFMIHKVAPAWLVGILLSAILSAIMSTLSSQLLVAASSLTEDCYQIFVKHSLSHKERIWAGRLGVMLVAMLALFLAWNPNNSILDLVAYAWGGLGASFGPLVLMSLYSSRTTWQNALVGMIVGSLTVIIWKQTSLSSTLYELFPGFCFSMATIIILNALFPQKDREVLSHYKNYQKQLAKKLQVSASKTYN